MDPTANFVNCPTAQISSATAKFTGTVTYRADMTWCSDQTTMSGSATILLPASCLVSNGITVTCDQLNQRFAANPTPGVTFHCVGSSGCTCSETIAAMDASGSGTYTTAGGGVTQTSFDGTTNQANYCVMGNTLTLTPQSDPGQTRSGSLVLSKN
jgi:hypothetical protein